MGDTPVYWKCSKCRLSTDRSIVGTRVIFVARCGRPEPTGRVRSPNSYRPSVEYRCGACGRIGWSRHPAAVSTARAKGFCPEYGAKG